MPARILGLIGRRSGRRFAVVLTSRSGGGKRAGDGSPGARSECGSKVTALAARDRARGRVHGPTAPIIGDPAPDSVPYPKRPLTQPALETKQKVGGWLFGSPVVNLIQKSFFLSPHF